MLNLALTVVAVFVVLVGCEVWWRKHEANEEFSRKTAHIAIGSFVAFWPFFLTWTQIEVLSIAFFVVVSVSKYLHVFEAIHSVQRPTWGELFFALAVGGIALVTHNKWIYAASLLQMSLADGLAAIIGTRFGGKHKYLVLNHPKSLAGTVTFFLTSFAILLAFNQKLEPSFNLIALAGISLLASVIENLGIKGSDNLLAPLVVALILSNA